MVGLIILVISIVGLSRFLSARQTDTSYLPIVSNEQSVQATPNPTSQIYLPEINRDATPTIVPTPTPVILVNVWIVSYIEEAGYYRDGYNFDLATFYNRDDPNVVLYAHCANPDWPSPEIGKEYYKDEWGMLRPIVNNATNNLQGFVPLP